MNKVIACLIAVVAALIVALVLLNRQLTPPTAPAPAVSSSQPSSAKLPDLPDIGGSREPAAAAPEVTGTGKTLPPLPDSLEIGDPGIHRAPISNTTVTDGEGAPAPSPTTDQASETASSGSVPAAGTQTDNASEPQQTSAGSEPAPSQMAPEKKPRRRISPQNRKKPRRLSRPFSRSPILQPRRLPSSGRKRIQRRNTNSWRKKYRSSPGKSRSGNSTPRPQRRKNRQTGRQQGMMSPHRTHAGQAGLPF